MTDPRTDRGRLQDEAYADSGNLRARASIYADDDGGFELLPWVLGTVRWPVDGPVLDVGCGPGRYLDAVGGGVGLDLSLGMAREASRVEGVAAVQGDVQALPVADGAVARVLAPHMLYHAPDPAGAVAELRRVLGPGGDAVIVLNDVGHLRELRDQVDAAVDEPRPWEALCTHEAVPLLEACFDDVQLHPVTNRLSVTDAEAVATYVASIEAVHGSECQPWSAVVDHVRAWAQGQIAEHGHAAIHTRLTTVVAR